jgi:hypothetical protein
MGEDPRSARVREAIGPWRAVAAHSAYAQGGAAAVDAVPGGKAWREELERLAAEDEYHLLAFEGHVTHLLERDRHLLTHIDAKTMVGDRDRITGHLARLVGAGYREVIYTPSGPDVPRELPNLRSRAPAAVASEAGSAATRRSGTGPVSESSDLRLGAVRAWLEDDDGGLARAPRSVGVEVPVDVAQRDHSRSRSVPSAR